MSLLTLKGMPEKKIPTTYFTKGNYFAVSGYCPFNTLIYPLPERGGLGTHLTLDLGNQALLGPDVEPMSLNKNALDSDQPFDYSIIETKNLNFTNKPLNGGHPLTLTNCNLPIREYGQS